MTLRLYDFEFNLLGAEQNVIKTKWSVYYNNVGTFEAHLSLNSKLVKTVMENPYMVAVQDGFSAIVVGKELGDELVLYGRTCNWLLSKRISPKRELITSVPGEYAAQVVNDAFYDTQNFVLGNIVPGNEAEFENDEGLALDIVTNCLAGAKLGHEVVFDIKNKRWVFNILEGTQNSIVLSECHKNAWNTKGTFDIIDMATCGIYKEYTDTEIVSKSIVKNPEKTGIYRWETLLFGKNKTEAGAELEKKSPKNEISLGTKGIVFGKDYQLGDKVRVQMVKGGYRTTEEKRIKGVEKYYAQGIASEQPIFE